MIVEKHYTKYLVFPLSVLILNTYSLESFRLIQILWNIKSGKPLSLLPGVIKGVPRPSLTWYKNGEPLQQNEKYEIDELTGRLLFVTVDSEDSGSYILRADNSGMFSFDSLAPLSLSTAICS